jgi:hypothetical protein
MRISQAIFMPVGNSPRGPVKAARGIPVGRLAHSSHTFRHVITPSFHIKSDIN